MNIEKNRPMVSIMIPTYNQERYIADAVKSAAVQDYDELEVIVADDCSTDRTSEIVKELEKKYKNVKYVRNSQNLGRVGNYHHTVHEIAHGKWAINLDGDDYFTSVNFIKDALECIEALKDGNIVAYCFRHPNLEKIKAIIPYKNIDKNRIVVKGKDYFLNYHKVGHFGHMNTLFRRDLGVSLELYTLPYQASDFHSLIRLFLLGDIVLDRRIIGKWRIHGKNTTILELEDKQPQAMLTFDAIEVFAKQYCTKEELLHWRKSMNRAAYMDYVQTYVQIKKDWYAKKLLLCNPCCKYWYFRSWIKQIIGR